MCGIFGTWNYKGVKGENLLESSRLLRHRGPDDEGFLSCSDGAESHFTGPDSKVDFPALDENADCENTLLHRRLSILDLSPKGHQPMQLEGRRIYITFNGEIYNFKELIKQHDLKVNSDSDTEVLLHLYDKFGTAMFGQMRGMWALAILDLEKNQLVLSRDRFGIKPLFLAGSNGELAFSSEIKPLLELPRISRNVKTETILEFVVFGASSDPYETFFEEVKALKPGVVRTYPLDDLTAFKEEVYYDLREAVKSSDFTSDTFKERFSQSIDEHLIADVEVGACLSGGLDSSLIVTSAADKMNGSFKTFTCAFPGQSIDESDFARKVNSPKRDLEQHFVEPTAIDFQNAWDKLILLQERPFGSASIFAQYTVMGLAAENGVKVLLDGQGADEMLGGYYPFAGAYLIGLLRNGKPQKFRKEYANLKKNFNPKMNLAMLRSAYYAMPKSVQLMGRKKQRLGFDLLSQNAKTMANDLQQPDRGDVDFTELSIKSVTFGLYELLQYEDRNAMAFSIESRVPYLDHRLVEWAVTQPVENKIHGGWTKFPIREALEKDGLSELAWRVDKLGFVAPQDKWRKELGDDLVKSAMNMDIPPIFDKAAVQNLMTQKLSGNAGASEFWRMFALLRWLELFKVNLI